MPINYADYPEDWPQISDEIRFIRAEGRCETIALFPDCKAEHGKPHPETGSKVVLTVAHLDHNRANIDPGNLRALCQRCHLAYDQKHHLDSREKNRRDRMEANGQINFLKPRVLPGS